MIHPDSKLFSFQYDGRDFFSYAPTVEVHTEKDGFIKTYTYGALRVTTTVRLIPAYDACEWVHTFENIGAEPTMLISSVRDADVALDFPHQETLKRTAYLADESKLTHLYTARGSEWNETEFRPTDRVLKNGDAVELATSGGRSSQAAAPFFHAAKEGYGVLFAVGWTGQWSCRIERASDALIIQSGIEALSFRLHPHEKIRTSSFLMMSYSGRVIDGHNRWRRLLKQHFSHLGGEGREAYAPLCAGLWGGMSSKGMLDRIRAIERAKIPVEYFWIDAGWYGVSEKPSPDEFEGDWSASTGDWRVNPTHHPDGLYDVVRKIKESGKKLLLWFEPERVMAGTPIVAEHPEYFLGGGSNRLLNLGDEAAWQYCFDTLCGLIERLSVDCYRQDFNFDPLSLLRSADEEDRHGMTEIRYIMGLYRLWDALAARFPHLLIDNCASGGRRIDVETLRRSVPLWRSDFQCPANFAPEGTQMHSISFGLWMPYSGTGTGRGIGDTYRFRSSYANGLTAQYTFSEKEPFGDPADCAWLRKMSEEYLQIRPYLSADLYPLTDNSASRDLWCAVEYFDNERKSGILQIFRRENSPYETAILRLDGLDRCKKYAIRDVDTGCELVCDGETLLHEGMRFTVPNVRCAKLYQIREIQETSCLEVNS